jgi:hypothetical protein
MKIDPYKHKERWNKWKEQINGVIPDISSENSKIILRYLNDMEVGINTSLASKRGSRSFSRLNAIRNKLVMISKKLDERFGQVSLIELTEQEVCLFFSEMRMGKIKREDGKNYRCTKDMVKNFKSFWHWWQKVSKDEGKEIKDITVYLDTSGDKPKWVYLNEEEIKLLYDNAKLNYKPLIMFLFDSGIRSPTELVNIKVSDLFNDCKELNIRNEVSKTFGRRIKLMICSKLLKEHIERNNLVQEDFIFPIDPRIVNRYLKRLAKRLFGEGVTLAGEKVSELTLYDFRHISCCYWLPRYKSESALKFRFGWKKSDKIYYYSELIGMRDDIQEEDLLVDVTKTELEKRLSRSEQKNDILESQLEVMKNQIKEIYYYVTKLSDNVMLLKN